MASSEGQSAQEFSRIMAEIRSQLNGNPRHDYPILMEHAERYRNHPLAREIVKEIGRMLYAALPPEEKANLDKSIDSVYGPLFTGLTDAERRLSSGDAAGARRSLEAVIKEFDPRGDICCDDAVSEYRIFYNPYEACLYQKLFRPTREVRQPPFDLTRLYFMYGTILVELQDLDAAAVALRRAQHFSPIDPSVLFELGEVLKMQRRWEEYRGLSMFALSVAFAAEQAARAYRNLGYYFTEQANYDAAVACYHKSASIDKESIPRCAHELAYIQQQAGAPTSSITEANVDEVLRNNGVAADMADTVREAIAQVNRGDSV